jgi:hypothetical protein
LALELPDKVIMVVLGTQELVEEEGGALHLLVEPQLHPQEEVEVAG